MPKIITVAAYKGGVGKTTLALELAYLLDAPLVDLDWDLGGATRRWGYRPTEASPLLDALEQQRVPRPRRGKGKADLVPGDRALEANQPSAEFMSETLEKWAVAWGSPYVVVDTHPGGSPATLGAMSAASVVVTPTVLATAELDGLEGLAEDAGDYPLVVVPNKVPRVPDRRLTNRLRDIVKRFDLDVAPVLSEYRRLTKRTSRMAITALQPAPKAWGRYADELQAVARYVREYQP